MSSQFRRDLPAGFPQPKEMTRAGRHRSRSNDVRSPYLAIEQGKRHCPQISTLRLGGTLDALGLDLGELDGEFLLDERFGDAEVVEPRSRVTALGEDAEQKVFAPM
jgi:hypothetical protein